MTADRRTGLQEAERLLKQGKLQEALGELQRAAEHSGGDLFALNRLGDLLARQGRRSEAIDHYLKIARQFADGGFVPKAIAIHKKVLRLDPSNLPSTVELGELYFKENLRGEARDHFLHAANQYLEQRDYDHALALFQRLIAIEPKELRHKVRLAETRAAKGELREAGEELLGLGRSLLDADRASEAEQVYRRAAELLPDSQLPTLGLARCLTQAGRAEAALELLERAATEPRRSPAVLAELAVRYDQSGRGDLALRLLAGAPVLEIPPSAWKAVAGGSVRRGESAALWEQLDRGLADGQDPVRTAALLETLGQIEEHGHVPALQRLLALQRPRSEPEEIAQTLTALIRAYEARSMADEASKMREELQRLVPPSAAKAAAPAAPVAPVRAAGPAAPRAPKPQPAPRAAPPPPAVELAPEIEAPAVPLNRADEEFVAGRLTQAEVLEKYGLRAQALEQLEEVTTRYPGHVGAQESRVKLLRAMENAAPLAEALAELAVARRAEGDAGGARDAGREAAAGPLSAAARRALGQLGLLEDRAAAAPGVAPPPGGQDVDLVIDFDGETHADELAAEPLAIERHRAVQDAASDADADLMADFVPTSSPEIESAGEDVAAAPPARTPLAAADTTLESALSGGDEDLRAIAEALESELFAEGGEPFAAEEADSEQAFEEVFSSFKERVAAEVGAGDHRTHYDLGIAYKEMGLGEEAIREFEVALASPELCCQACAMIAMCHREGARIAEASAWYRRALAAPGGSGDATAGLRYDLADVLIEAGEDEAALAEFRAVLTQEPGFRDVGERVAEIEQRLRG